MEQVNSSKKKSSLLRLQVKQRLLEALLILLALISLFLFITLCTYHRIDTRQLFINDGSELNNFGGILGAKTAYTLINLLGWTAFSVPFLLAYVVIDTWLTHHKRLVMYPLWIIYRCVGFLCLTVTLAVCVALLSLHIQGLMPIDQGGFIGTTLAHHIHRWFGGAGAAFIVSLGFFIGITLLSRLIWHKLVNKRHNQPREFQSIKHNPPARNEQTKLSPTSKQLEQCLHNFGITATVIGVYPGPVVTLYEVDLAPGIKINKIHGLVKDLARALSVRTLRVVEVIPGKTAIGFELPNEHREVVKLCDVLASQAYQQARSYLSIGLGVDTIGQPVVVDLATMPHLLIAGTTGSGKSVGLHAIVMSLLYKGSTKDVRFIMVDPKMLELSAYAGIPHLLTPVITQMPQAAQALEWCIQEMDRRYELMASLGVRNLASYHEKRSQLAASSSPSLLEPLPAIVVIIDEFADMMMVIGKKAETLIARIAQKARAAGIHLILATQRPSVHIVTPILKANIPTRISFLVASRADSRAIIEQHGAEQLLGHGDMLYLPAGSGSPMRVHGAFVEDNEVKRLVLALKKLGTVDDVFDILKPSVESDAMTTQRIMTT